MFEDEVLLLTALLEIQLPMRTIRLCDGGFVNWPARGMFDAEDSVFGTIESSGGVSDSISDEAPNWTMTLLPKPNADINELLAVDAQGSRALIWMASVNRATGTLVGDPELIGDSQLDTLTVVASKGQYKIDMEFVSSAERLFMVMEGVAVVPRWHKAIWPGEQGLDHVTGTATAVPWGVPSPGRGNYTIVGGGGGMAGNGGGGGAASGGSFTGGLGGGGMEQY